MSQTVLDSVLENYEGVYDDNYHQFAPNYDTLEEGDGFVLGAPHYLHFFFTEDSSSRTGSISVSDCPFSSEGRKITCILRKQNT